MKASMTKGQRFRATKRINNNTHIYAVLLCTILWTISPISSLAKPHAKPQLHHLHGPVASEIVVKKFLKLVAETPAGQKHEFQVNPVADDLKNSDLKPASESRPISRQLDHLDRPLTAAERSSGKRELVVARVPIAFFAAKEVGQKNLTINKVCDILSGYIGNWSEVGGADVPLVVYRVPKSHPINLTLIKNSNCDGSIGAASAIMREFPTMEELNTALANNTSMSDTLTEGSDKSASASKPSLSGTPGKAKKAVAFYWGTLKGEPRGVQIKVQDFRAGVPMGLIYNIDDVRDPLIVEMNKLSHSPDWSRILSRHHWMNPGYRPE